MTIDNMNDMYHNNYYFCFDTNAIKLFSSF